MIELIKGGSVTSAKGFIAGGTYAGLKRSGEDVLDLGLLYSEVLANVAATFTTNMVKSPSVVLSQRRVAKGKARAVVANSGCANACVGEQGLKDAEEFTALAAKHVGIQPEEVLICSTGLIGVELPMALIRHNIGNIHLSEHGGHKFARAIMTTDSHPKEMAISVDLSGRKVTLGGAAKGVGMIHPNMATMLCFIATDAPVGLEFLRKATKEAIETSFNQIDVDGDTSTNDTCIVMANGKAGGQPVEANPADAKAFQEALTYICISLAKELARDGEGAQRLLEVVVDGAKTVADARKAAREVCGSNLVKSMVHGRDPNWGRIMMALGKSGIDFDESKVDIFINDIHIVHDGVSIPYMKEAVISAMSVPDVQFRLSLHAGEASGTAWGCDLTEEYVTFNSAYAT
ncbi:MAG: bifunctional glutamate N-acetyltransferase/amino-acid acetyltransferase ArgJ [SAR202 cluster bacterium]|nr:bifunctional glutamate N-acetyltransferase/amino-acid acetyltransferase ArgJ [SAR202 cluster bacterium]